MFCYEIAAILHSIILNIDRALLKYVFVRNFTLARKVAKPVTVEENDDKRCITATFGILLNINFLPIQLIYAGKRAELTRYKFPDEFGLSVNPTHYSNSTESIKLIDEIVALYLESERQNLNLPPAFKGLLILDVFTDQITGDVNAALNKSHVYAVHVPANMIRFYQPLHLTVNGQAKKFMKNKFHRWYATEITKLLNEGVKLDEVNVRLLLSTLKPLYVGWV